MRYITDAAGKSSCCLGIGKFQSVIVNKESSIVINLNSISLMQKYNLTSKTNRHFGWKNLLSNRLLNSYSKSAKKQTYFMKKALHCKNRLVKMNKKKLVVWMHLRQPV